MSCHLQTQDKFHELLVQDPSIAQLIQTSSFDALWFWNPHKPNEGWRSDSFWKLLGYDPEITVGRPTCDEVIYPDDLMVTVQQAHLHLKNNQHPYDATLRFYAQDGSIVWLRSRGQAIYNQAHQPIGLFGTYVNVTHLNQPVKDFGTSESLNELLLDNDDVYTITILRNGTYSYVSPSFCADLGLDPRDIIGSSSLFAVIPEDQSKCAEAAKFCFNNPHQPFYTTLRKRFRDGTTYLTQWEFIGLFDISGTVGKILGIGTNVTRRISAAARQLYLTNLLNTTQAIANIGGWEVDLVTEQVTWTDQVYKIHEVEADFVPTLDNGFGFYHPDDRKAIETTFAQSIQTREPFDIVCRIITAKNNLRWARSSGRPTVHNGQVTHMTGVFQDITQQMKTEQDLRNTLDEKTVLLNEIHHRVKNNLQVVASLLNLQARQL
ncbi:MAG: PAS domain-containing protein, partial [Deinococcota bacterium]